MVQSQTKKKNALHDLGYKIFLDRYALKDMKRETLAVGDLVIVVVNSATGQREVGRITAMQLPQVTIELLDGEVVVRDIEHVDKPLETDPAQMMDRVAAGIAAVEKTTKKRREWTDKFRWLLEDWKFVPGGRILTAAGTDQELTFYNCMPPEQEILTADGYKPIADVRVGELVVTHKNRLRPVLHKFERETEEDIYTITPKKIGYDVLRVTGEHKIHVIRSEWVNNGRLVAGQTSDWIPANQLNTGDFVSVAYNGEVCPPDPIYVRDYLPQYDQILELDADLCFLFGRWLGNGVLTPDSIEIFIEQNESNFPESNDDISRILNTVMKKFGVKPQSFNPSPANNQIGSIIIEAPRVSEFFNAFFGVDTKHPRIPNQLMHMESPYTHAFLNGLFSASSSMNCETLEIALPNRTIAIQIHQLLLRLGYFFDICTDDGCYCLTTLLNADTRKLSYGRADNQFSREFVSSPDEFEYDSLHWVRIESITTENYRGMVMDIEVEEDHSFVSAGLVVSNCYVIPLVGDSRGGIIETLGNMTEIMSRGGGVGINLSTLRPRHAYVKGVNGRSSGSVSWGALYSFVTGLIEQGGSRRGALMLILNDWHPDIFDFVNSKREAGKITNANISVGLSDRFMDAMKADGDWHLQFPDTSHPDYDTLWDGDLEKWIEAGREVITYKTIKAKELWNAIIESAWASAEPGVWFRERSNKMSNSWYFNPLIATNPCGEQPLSAYSVCNLGAINLAIFYDEQNHDVAWDDLERTVSYATRFLDNVIDTTPYFFEENRKVQLAERRVGLGTMGVAELMIKLHIRYGSDESVEFIDKLYKFMAVHAYKTSSIIAKEKGAFPQFDPEKFLQSGFMADMPDDVREQIRKDGIRNVTLLTQAPTGCVAPDTLVSTSTGLQPIVNLGDPNGTKWQSLNLAVHTDVGLREATQFYVNGSQPVKKITTNRGFTITATHNHQIRVIDECGNYVWRRMDELRVGDTPVLKKNTLGDGEIVPLIPVEQGNRAMSELPTHMTPEFAEMLGLYMGDGYTKERGGLHIVVAQKDPDLLEHVKMRLQSVWGERYIGVEEHTGCWVANLTGYYIGRFFEANGMKKPSGNHGEGAAGAFIPAKVLAAGREVVKAFLRGLFEADGSIHRGTITLVSTSETLIKQVQIALLGLGIVATIRQMPKQDDRYGERILHELRILNRRECDKFVQEINFISQRKRAKAQDLGTISDRGDNVAHPELLKSFYAQSQGLPSVYRQKIAGLVSNGSLTQQSVKQFVQDYPVLAQSPLAQLISMDVYLDTILTIEDGISATYDLSVPDNHTYIANGFVSHNTTGTMVNTSTGIEPFFSWVYYRKSRLGLHEEQVPIVQDWYAENPQADKLPDYFITAMDLAPMEHVKVQGAFQRWIDSAISKTANLPNNYTVQQTAELYEYMYSLGCKGGTIYRDGSRDEQVLMLKGDERAEKENDAKSKKEDKVEQVATPHRVYPRPKRLHGVTVNSQTPFGTAYITMNSDEQGYPFEVFITAPGKAGSDLQADAEGLGRMISLSLRTTEPHNRREMLRLIIDQLRDIGGARSIGFGMERVISLPDAVARALEDNYFPKSETLQLQIPMMDVSVGKPVADKKLSNGNGHDHHHEVEVNYSTADLCPSCGTISLIRSEGCRRCLTCDYTEC